MNFKTTLTLLIALVVVGLLVFFRSGKDEQQGETTTPRKLIAVSPESVTGVTVTPASGEAIAFTRGTDGNWQLTKPVTAAAEKFQVDDLVREVTSLESRGQVDASTDRGFDRPQYTVSLQAGDKSHEIVVGAAAGVGDNLYVRVDGSAKANMVAASLLEQLEKPASTYRQPKLVTETIDQFQQLTVTREGETLALAKDAEKWSVIAPTSMPADTAAVNELLSAVTGLRAEEFVSEGADTAAVGQPRLTLSYSTAPPSTQPATTQPVKTIVVGRFSDISKKSVLATSPTIGAVVKLATTSLDAFDKKPLDLRDKQVLTLDTARVSSIELKGELVATTHPTTRPATNKRFALTRRPPAASQPTTTETAASKWLDGSGAPANDAAVDAILSIVGSLRAEKFVDSIPVIAQPSATYDLTLVVPPVGPSLGERYELRVLDFGQDTPPVATYNGLTFNVSRSLLTALEADLAAAKQP